MNWFKTLNLKTAQFDSQITNPIDSTTNLSQEPLSQPPDYNNWNTDPYLNPNINHTPQQQNKHKLKPGKGRGISNKKNPIWRHAPNGAHLESDFGKTPNPSPLIKKDFNNTVSNNPQSQDPISAPIPIL